MRPKTWSLMVLWLFIESMTAFIMAGRKSPCGKRSLVEAAGGRSPARLGLMPFTLNEAEFHAVRWALSAAGSVVQRAVREGRMAGGQVSVTPADELESSLRAGVLVREDMDTILSALRFAASLHEPGMEDIRQVLEPPAAATIASAMTKIEAGPGRQGTVTRS